jgi:hypothetical protein
MTRTRKSKNETMVRKVWKIHLDSTVIKLFTAVIYRHSMVILSFCVMNTYYLGNYNGLAVDYHGICKTNVIKHNLTQK